jgi:hypothetical protein
MPAPTDESERALMSAHTNVRHRSRVEDELALRPEYSAPSPDATDGAICATRREAELLVLTAGPLPHFYGRYPTGPVDASQSD